MGLISRVSSRTYRKFKNPESDIMGKTKKKDLEEVSAEIKSEEVNSETPEKEAKKDKKAKKAKKRKTEAIESSEAPETAVKSENTKSKPKKSKKPKKRSPTTT